MRKKVLNVLLYFIKWNSQFGLNQGISLFITLKVVGSGVFYPATNFVDILARIVNYWHFLKLIYRPHTPIMEIIRRVNIGLIVIQHAQIVKNL